LIWNIAVILGLFERFLFSLTVVRMLPVLLVLGGLKLRTDQKLFMGCFGPRGLASIVFGVIVMNAHLPGGTTLSMTAVGTIRLSIIGHGRSATPLVAALTKGISGF
jgi:NhaP-type Na+/H+ or K+/H+ antiporter